ncbi:MAG: mechanosensitive ion channel domain-containing protein [Planctomycetota bacterium]
MARIRIAAVVLVLAASSVVLGFQPASSRPALPARRGSLEVQGERLDVPRTPANVAACLRVVEDRLAALAPTTQPASAPAGSNGEGPPETHVQLYRVWQQVSADLHNIGGLLDSLDLLSSERHTRSLAEKIERVRRQTAELRSAPRPITAVESEVAETRQRHVEANGEFEKLSQARTRRAALLAGGFDEQRAKLSAELGELSGRQAELEARISGTTTAPSDREQLVLLAEKSTAELYRHQLLLRALELAREQAELESTQESGYLSALKEYVETLGERASVLAEARGRSVLDQIRIELAAAKEPHRVAFLELALFKEAVLLEYFKKRELVDAIESRFPASSLDRLQGRVESSEVVWNRIVETLAQRAGEEVSEARVEVIENRRQHEKELVRLRDRLGESLFDLGRMQSARERALTRFAELEARLGKLLATVPAAERTRIETEATALRSGLLKSSDESIASLEGLVDRLNAGVSLLDDYTLRLHDIETKLYWAALLRRESGLAGLDWSAVGSECRQLFGARDAKEVPSSASAHDQLVDLFAAPVDARAALGENLDQLGADLRGITGMQWTVITAVLIVVCAPLVWVRRAAVRQAGRLAAALVARGGAENLTNKARPLDDRVHLFMWRLSGSVLPPLAIVLVLWGGLAVAGLPTRTLQPVIGGFCFFMAAWFSFAVAGFAFSPARPAQRLIACGDAVARHYRKWAMAVVVCSIVLLPVPLLLGFWDVLPAFRSSLWEVYKTGVLLMLVFFAVHKRDVIGTGAAPRTNWIGVFVSTLYPFLALGLIALLLLQVAGYGLLVEFAGGGALASAGIILLVSMIVAYCCDLVDRHVGRRGSSDSESGAAVPSGSTGAGAGKSEAAEEKSASDLEPAEAYITRLAKGLARCVGVVATVFLLSRVWALPIRLHNLNWRVIGLGLAAFVVALLVDRVLYSALHTLRVTGRLPSSTVRIIRRWARGLLIAIVVLFVIGQAGFKIDNFWTLMSTLLAMVAIGFVAVWSVLSNVLCTLIILIWRPFNVGEHIEIQPENIAGKVIDINFMQTLLRTENGDRVAVPNSIFMQRFIKRRKTVDQPRTSLADQLMASEPAEQ